MICSMTLLSLCRDLFIASNLFRRLWLRFLFEPDFGGGFLDRRCTAILEHNFVFRGFVFVSFKVPPRNVKAAERSEI